MVESGQALDATVIIVAFKNALLDLSWIPPQAPVVIVHNDDTLDATSLSHGNVVHLQPESNLGFGKGANLGAAMATTRRLILCNPDIKLAPDHWVALTEAHDDEVVTVALKDLEGRSTSVVNEYPTPISLLLTGYRVGRFFPRDGFVRRQLRHLGGWWRAHAESFEDPVGTWPLIERWPSGAVLSLSTDRFLSVGGFNEDYFLYFEDVDLARRLANGFPSMVIRCVSPSGCHHVGGSAIEPLAAARAEYARCLSARIYAQTKNGWRWRIVSTLLRPRIRWLRLRLKVAAPL